MKQKHLMIVFVVLLGILVGNYFFNRDHNERTFNRDMITVDTSVVSAITFYPKSNNFEEVKLFKESEIWKVSYNGKAFPAGKSAIQSVLTQLSGIVPKRVAAKTKDSWIKYEVTDSTGTRIKVESDGKEIADLIIGKFSYNQQMGSSSSFLRRNGEDEVFEVDGFLSMSFNRPGSSFRDNQIIFADKSSWNRITYSYPGDSSFVLSGTNGFWMVNGMPVDSIKTANYLSSLARLGSPEFIEDDQIHPNIMNPQYMILIEGDGMEKINLSSFYLDETRNKVLISSLNKGAMFDGNASGIFDRTFVNAAYFKP
jgi:hypothetical protein